jgi:hypothetical protein
MLLDTVSPAVLFDPYFEAWRWLYGGAAPQPNMVFAAIVVAAFLACAPFLLGSVLKARGPMLAWILVPVVVVVLLNTAVSEPIWRSWIIAKVQFPWRLMTFADFATGIAAAVLAAGATCRIGWWVLSVALMTALIPVAFLAAQVTFTMQGNPAEKRYDAGFGAMEYLSPEMTETLRTRLARPDLDHFDQRQIAATLADMAAEFAETQPPVQILQRGSRSITIAPPPGAAILSLPVQFWVLWAAETASGTPLQLRANPQFGTIDILPPPEGFADTPVHLSLRYHPSEQLGAAVSVLALLVLLGAALLSRKRRAVGP